MGQIKVAIIIPAYNEVGTIQHVIESVGKYGQPIVVDDHSSDGTSTLAKQLGATVFTHELNQGYDVAINTGFSEAVRLGYEYIITFDADNQHDATLINNFIAYFEQGYELIVGIRPHYYRIAERFFAFYTKLRFGLKDPLCGMKGYKATLYKELGWFDSYRSIGTELMLYGLLNKKKFIQFPITIAERDGIPRFGQGLRANCKIIRAMILSLFKLNRS